TGFVLSTSGHARGVETAIQGVDKIIGQLMNGLKQLGLHRCVNMLIVADHGMEETSCDRKEVLQELVGDTSNYFVIQGPFGRIRGINKDTVGELMYRHNLLSCYQKIKPYLKAHLPKRLHFANSRRIEDVNVLVEPKWLFERAPQSLTFCSGGNHGYDNDVESMHAMFVGYGPKFLNQTEIEPFSSIELYNLMCDVLEIFPTHNNGTHGSMNHILRKPYHIPTHPAEQSVQSECPLESLLPGEALGCSCSGLVSIVTHPEVFRACPTRRRP
uniref:Venom phosphodiesterase 1-like n=1 Tax=Stegastes partitus TaxID=144197 RepID=A0A3B5B9A7_9TELE